MMIEEGKIDTRPKTQIAQEARAIEDTGGIAQLATHGLARHVALPFATLQLPQLRLHRLADGEIEVIAAGKQTAAQHYRADVAVPAAGNGEAFVDRLERDPVAVDLDAGEPFQRHRADQPVIVEHAGAGVMGARMNTEDEHAAGLGDWRERSDQFHALA